MTANTPIQFNYPLRYSKGLVDGKYKIIRIDKIDDKDIHSFFVYFRVDQTVYVGFACYIFPSMGIAQAKIAKSQDVRPIEEEYLVTRKKTKAGRKAGKIKLAHHTVRRVPLDYEREQNNDDTEYKETQRLLGLPQEANILAVKEDKLRKLAKRHEKIAGYIDNLIKKKKTETKKQGLDGINTDKSANELSKITSIERGYTIAGKYHENM